MWETIELREIRVFLALADELHFGRAAERLGVTQSRVSQSLRTLEAKLGERLIHRTSRHVALTAAGERFSPTSPPPTSASSPSSVAPLTKRRCGSACSPASPRARG
jgi:predicted DNA-binding protein (UPF0251 family)